MGSKKGLKRSDTTDLDFSKYNSDVLEARKLHSSIIKKSYEAFKDAVKLGKELKQKKEELPHGQFGKYIEYIGMFSERTARRYMQFYEKENEIKDALGETLDISTATKFLSSLNPKERKKIVSTKTEKIINDFQLEVIEARKVLRLSVRSKKNLLTDSQKKTIVPVKQKDFQKISNSLMNRLEELEILGIPTEELEPFITRLTNRIEEFKNLKRSDATDLESETANS